MAPEERARAVSDLTRWADTEQEGAALNAAIAALIREAEQATRERIAVLLLARADERQREIASRFVGGRWDGTVGEQCAMISGENLLRELATQIGYPGRQTVTHQVPPRPASLGA